MHNARASPRLPRVALRFARCLRRSVTPAGTALRWSTAGERLAKIRRAGNDQFGRGKYLTPQFKTSTRAAGQSNLP